MKRPFLPLCLSLCLLSCCQPVSQTGPHSPTESLQPAAEVPRIAAIRFSPKPAPFGKVKALPNQQLQVDFTYPDPQTFKIQAFACGEVAFASIAVAGPALGTDTLYANGSDTTHNMFTANNCQISGTVDQVPYGDLVVTIRLYDAERNLLAGSELLSGITVSEASPTVEVSYRQTNVGQLLNALRKGEVADQFLAGQLDLAALQSFFDTLTNVSGTFPAYQFTQHPALINIPALVSALRANGGNIAALDPLDTRYVYSAGSARFELAGVLIGQSVSASIDDMLSADATVNSNGEVVITDLPPGSWTLRLSGPGYIDQRVSVTVSEGQATQLGTLTMLAPPPSLTSLSPATGVSGSSITIQGADFNSTPANHTVLFGTTPATVTAASATQLTVTVPGGLSLGEQPVSVAIGAGQAVTGPRFTVVRPTVSALSVSAGEIGSQVVLTGTHFNATAAHNTVKFGEVTATVEAATDTELTLTVPEGLFGSVPLTVANLQSPASDAVNFAITPKITGLSQATGSTGDSLTLTGTGFDPTSSNNTVRLGTHTVSTVSATGSTELQLTLPEVPAGTANATVQVGNQTSTAANFAFIPKLTALSSSAVVAGKAALIRGQTLTITGSNFDPVAANNSVTFGATPVTPASATATELNVTVPASANSPGDLGISVTSNTRDSNVLTAMVPSLNLNFNGGFQ